MLEIRDTTRAFFSLPCPENTVQPNSGLLSQPYGVDSTGHSPVPYIPNVRDPHELGYTVITDKNLDEFTACIGNAVAVAIDTETPISGPSARQLRVMSAATRSPTGEERAWVFDARDYDPAILASALTGVEAAAWNANFDAGVLDRAIWKTTDTTTAMIWWDAQLADALLYQGRSGFNWYHGLAWATEYYLGIEAEGKGSVQISFDANSDLSETQLAYAAADAIETLWVADVIRGEIQRAGMSEICEIEQRARPFLDQMSRTGLPLDIPGWRAALEQIDNDRKRTLDELAMLTGGGQGSLFSPYVQPSWNPASEQQSRKIINEYETERVRNYFVETEGQNRLLGVTDSLGASTLRSIGGKLPTTLLRYRSTAKLLNTYGESMIEALGSDSRLHSQYLQVVGTNTGRLASRKPNVQNLSEQITKYIRPADSSRVFVYADLSQAELRYLAQVSSDSELRRAFSSGEDIHERTARSMFAIGETTTKNGDQTYSGAEVGELRQVAKALNFGIAYGLGAAGLARTLSDNGRKTTVEEGNELIQRYRSTYQGAAQWAKQKSAELHRVASAIEVVDWAETLQLAEVFATVNETKRMLRRKLRRWPKAEEIRGHLDELVLSAPSGADSERAVNTSRAIEKLLNSTPDVGTGVSDEQYNTQGCAQNHENAALKSYGQRDLIAWAMRFSEAVLVKDANTAFTYSARTICGRRIQFNIKTSNVCREVIARLTAKANPRLEALVTNCGLSENEINKAALSDKSCIDTVVYLMSMGENELLIPELRLAAKAEVHRTQNAWLNAPIQGGVADIVLRACAELDRTLRPLNSARPVLSVHDSIIIECDSSEANKVALVVQEALIAASEEICPEVCAAVDIDIRATLCASTVIS